MLSFWVRLITSLGFHSYKREPRNELDTGRNFFLPENHTSATELLLRLHPPCGAQERRPVLREIPLEGQFPARLGDAPSGW
jgi:hypothetical protein